MIKEDNYVYVKCKVVNKSKMCYSGDEVLDLVVVADEHVCAHIPQFSMIADYVTKVIKND